MHFAPLNFTDFQKGNSLWQSDQFRKPGDRKDTTWHKVGHILFCFDKMDVLGILRWWYVFKVFFLEDDSFYYIFYNICILEYKALQGEHFFPSNALVYGTIFV